MEATKILLLPTCLFYLVAALVPVEAARPLPAHPVEETEDEADEDKKDHRGQTDTDVVPGQSINALVINQSIIEAKADPENYRGETRDYKYSRPLKDDIYLVYLESRTVLFCTNFVRCVQCCQAINRPR